MICLECNDSRCSSCVVFYWWELVDAYSKLPSLPTFAILMTIFINIRHSHHHLCQLSPFPSPSLSIITVLITILINHRHSHHHPYRQSPESSPVLFIQSSTCDICLVCFFTPRLESGDALPCSQFSSSSFSSSSSSIPPPSPPPLFFPCPQSS